MITCLARTAVPTMPTITICPATAIDGSPLVAEPSVEEVCTGEGTGASRVRPGTLSCAFSEAQHGRSVVRSVPHMPDLALAEARSPCTEMRCRRSRTPAVGTVGVNSRYLSLRGRDSCPGGTTALTQDQCLTRCHEADSVFFVSPVPSVRLVVR